MPKTNDYDLDQTETSVARMVRTGLLYDFYSGLLTDKQRKVMELYYLENWSLAEIAESEGISRQAVHDLLRRSGKTIESLEEKLGLLARFASQQSALTAIAGKVEQALREAPSESGVHKLLQEIKTEIHQLIEGEILEG